MKVGLLGQLRVLQCKDIDLRTEAGDEVPDDMEVEAGSHLGNSALVQIHLLGA